LKGGLPKGRKKEREPIVVEKLHSTGEDRAGGKL